MVELLIVMVIIGILAGSLMLTMGGGKGKAEATRIVSDLRNLKAAATMYYIDNSEWPGGTDKTVAMKWITQSLDKYLDRDYPDGDSVDYYAVKDNSNRVFVGYGEITDDAVKESLKAMAADAALYGTSGFSVPTSSDITSGTTQPTYYDDQKDYVWMLVTR